MENNNTRRGNTQQVTDTGVSLTLTQAAQQPIRFTPDLHNGNGVRGRFPITKFGNDGLFLQRQQQQRTTSVEDPETSSGIILCRETANSKTATTGDKGDPRQKPSGMTDLFTTAGGFTLIELLVVVLIISILAAVALPQYNKAVEKSRIGTALPIMDSLKKSIDVWLLENGYPEAGTYEFLWVSGNRGYTTSQLVETVMDERKSLDCTGEEPGLCKDHNFWYEALCTKSMCGIWAYRSADSYNSDGDYNIMYVRSFFANQWEHHCVYFDKSGQRTCSALQGQGSWQINNEIDT